ncbi:hypothetical protein BDA96_08G091400 [Sorghum bicolor]|uniref:Uncharacterized protein n=1 Tax=Sorghum bicolor TaxID=4558 RepID=A0A921QGS2_SORBI|nr:hypothetical protein BDA96_08G091400 [Sorghum bicolor]
MGACPLLDCPDCASTTHRPPRHLPATPPPRPSCASQQPWPGCRYVKLLPSVHICQATIQQNVVKRRTMAETAPNEVFLSLEQTDQTEMVVSLASPT